MRHFRAVLTIAAAAMAVAACDDEAYREPMPQDMPPPADYAPLPPEEPTQTEDAPPQAPPPDYSSLPAPPETSEETVQPESETLFY